MVQTPPPLACLVHPSWLQGFLPLPTMVVKDGVVWRSNFEAKCLFDSIAIDEKVDLHLQHVQGKGMWGKRVVLC